MKRLKRLWNRERDGNENIERGGKDGNVGYRAREKCTGIERGRGESKKRRSEIQNQIQEKQKGQQQRRREGKERKVQR